MNDSLRFPDGFLFGAAISAYQTEGGNVNTDWWWWEHLESTPCREPSGDACDFYHRYAEDVAMLASAGLNCFRFSVEWARIEPAEGEFSRAALAHYRGMVDACHRHGVAPIVTFHHFTVPRWLHEQGGIAAENFAALFERYCARTADALGDRMAYACTINEPQGLGSSGWLLGVNPPGHTDDRDGAQRAVDNLLEAHRRGAAAIRSRAGVPAGVTLAIPDIQYEDGAQPGSSSLELECACSWFPGTIASNSSCVRRTNSSCVMVGSSATPRRATAEVAARNKATRNLDFMTSSARSWNHAHAYHFFTRAFLTTWPPFITNWTCSS